jgi:membrane-associated phospholipid phosphatase
MSPTVVYAWALVMLVRPLRGSQTNQIKRSRGVQPGVLPFIRGLNPAATHGVVRGVRWLLILPLVAVLVLTGIVNVHLGVHWPTDVLGGYLWGIVLLLPGLAIAKFRAPSLPSPRRERGRG